MIFQKYLASKQNRSPGCVLLKKVFLKIWQNSQKNTYVRVSFLISCRHQPKTLLKKILWHRSFPVNFASNTFFYRTTPVAASLKITENVNHLVYFWNVFDLELVFRLECSVAENVELV